MIPTLLTATSVFIIGIIAAPQELPPPLFWPLPSSFKEVRLIKVKKAFRGNSLKKNETII
jgi:hypothetical protein